VNGLGAATSACARCSGHLGRSCCEARDDEPLATLTRADVERIQRATHRARDGFVAQEVFDEAQARAYEELRPGWRRRRATQSWPGWRARDRATS